MEIKKQNQDISIKRALLNLDKVKKIVKSILSKIILE